MDEEIPGNLPQPAGTGPCWYALAERSLPVGSADLDPIHRWVVEATHALHLPVSDLGKIQRATAGAVLNLDEGRAGRTAIRLLLIRLWLAVAQSEEDGGEAARTGRQPSSASLPPGGVAGLQAERGWGFFLVERMVTSASGG